MADNSNKNTNQQIEALLLWQQSRGLRFPHSKQTKKQETQGDIQDSPQPSEIAPIVTDIDLLFISTKSSWNTATSDEAKSLLEKMIAAMKLNDSNVQTLVLDTEVAAEINKANALIKHSQHVVLLGEDTVKTLGARKKTAGATTDFDNSFSEVRGEWLEQQENDASAKMIATWHPTKLLDQPILKQDAWNDLKMMIESIKTK